jgi:junctophilin
LWLKSSVVVAIVPLLYNMLSHVTFCIILSLGECVVKATSNPPAASQEVRQKEALPPARPAPSPAPAVTTSAVTSNHGSNGQIHSHFHGYHVKADVKMPPPDDSQLELEDNFHPSSLAQLAPFTKQYRPPSESPVLALAPAPAAAAPPVSKEVSQPRAPETPRPKRQDSHKPKSLAETKKASLDMSTEIIEEESVSGRPRNNARSTAICQTC